MVQSNNSLFGLAVKVYDIDYVSILNNYLKPNTWTNNWPIFQFKNFIITMTLDSIYTQTNELSLYYKLSDGEHYCTSSIRVSLNNLNMKVLKKQINGCLFSLVETLERWYYIDESKEHNMIMQIRDKKRDKLQAIAEDFLDDQGVTNSSIRDCYITNYVDDNDDTSNLLSQLVNNQKYSHLRDLYLTLTESMEDKDRHETVINYKRDYSNINTIEIESYIESDEFESDMTDLLEGI